MRFILLMRSWLWLEMVLILMYNSMSLIIMLLPADSLPYRWWLHTFFGQVFFLRLDMWSAKIYLRKEVPIEDKPLDCPMLIKQWGEWIFKHWTVFKTLIGGWLVWGLWLLYYPLDFRRWWIHHNTTIHDIHELGTMRWTLWLNNGIMGPTKNG